MMKKVNVLVDRPIYTVNPPILRTVMGVELTPADIKRCLWNNAIVEEVFPSGATLPLDLRNFNKVNEDPFGGKVEPIVEDVVEELEEEVVEELEEEVVEEPEEEPIVEEPVQPQPKSAKSAKEAKMQAQVSGKINKKHKK